MDSRSRSTDISHAKLRIEVHVVVPGQPVDGSTDIKGLLYPGSRMIGCVTRLVRIDHARTCGIEGNNARADRTDRGSCRIDRELHRQPGGGCSGRSVSSLTCHCAHRRGRGKVDGLASLDIKGLLLRRGKVGAIPRLVGIDYTSAICEERDLTTTD